MKGIIFTLALIISITAFAQEENLIKTKSKFHHSIGLNLNPYTLGGYYVDGWFVNDYRVPFGGKHFLNLIPYYELDYNSKFFLQAYYRYTNVAYRDYNNKYHLIFSYNFLKPQSTSILRLGAGGCYNYPESKINSMFDSHLTYILYLSYQYEISKHFNIGVSLTFSSYKQTKTTVDNWGYSESIKGYYAPAFFIKTGYTF